jgi:uncharacterized membrane protein
MAQITPGVCVRWASAPLIVWALYFLRANVWFRLYPAVMVAGAFVLFALSLFRTPLVEVFARRMGETLDDRGRRYCRRVTQVWVSFLAVHLLATLATVFASRDVWALYNGVISYVLMGVLIVGERLFRRRFQRG